MELKEIIKRLLTEEEATRNDDHLLFIRVCAEICPGALNQPLYRVFTRRKELGLPNYDSVTRLRRMIQKAHPELLPCKEIKEHRECRLAEMVAGLEREKRT